MVNSRDVFGLGVCWPLVLVSFSVQLASTNQNRHAVSLANQEQDSTTYDLHHSDFPRLALGCLFSRRVIIGL